MIINKSMWPYFQRRSKIRIEKKYEKICSGGFFTKGGCLFLKKLYKTHYDSYEITHFHDETGFEAFVNSIDIEVGSPQDNFNAGIAFITCVMRKFKKETYGGNLLAMMSISKERAIVKVYLDRLNQKFIDDDFDSYMEPILLFDCNDFDIL